ncbi:MAG: hypothetical protein J6A55_03150, partial [Oscillospiraceae bacterium]|nr:hypothetical protein [Oscillospiraceae bacterium]
EINAIFSCIRIPVRTGVVLETMECPKTAQLKAFWKIDFRLAKKISSQSRYDHFDTSPNIQDFRYYIIRQSKNQVSKLIIMKKIDIYNSANL